MVLTGSLLRAGDHVRVTAQLVEAPEGTLLWSNSPHVALRDIFQLQDQIVDRIVESLSLSLTAREHRSLKVDVPASPTAYEFFLRGNQLILTQGVTNAEHLHVAREFYERCLQADPRYARFFALIALFTFAMVMLVMGANLFMLFMFWEIMGLCSYLLISHWSRRPSACDAATKAFLVNGVADIGLAFGIYLTWATFGTLDIQGILSAAPQYADQTVNLLGWLGLEWQAPILSVIALLLFMGPIGKSAQIPLHVWLPFAMEAPGRAFDPVAMITCFATTVSPAGSETLIS